MFCVLLYFIKMNNNKISINEAIEFGKLKEIRTRHTHIGSWLLDQWHFFATLKYTYSYFAEGRTTKVSNGGEQTRDVRNANALCGNEALTKHKSNIKLIFHNNFTLKSTFTSTLTLAWLHSSNENKIITLLIILIKSELYFCTSFPLVLYFATFVPLTSHAQYAILFSEL